MRFTSFDIYSHLTSIAIYFCMALTLLTGCTPVKKPNSIAAVEEQLRTSNPIIASTLAEKKSSANLQPLLEQKLTPQIAEKIMLLNSPRVDIELTKLGVEDTAAMQASLIRNPRFSIALLKPENNGHWLWDLGLTQPLVDLLSRSKRHDKAINNLKSTQLETGIFFQNVYNQLAQNYFAAVAAQQHLIIQKTLLEAAEAKRELANSLFQAGNISESDYLTYLTEAEHHEHLLISEENKANNQLSDLAFMLGIAVENCKLPEKLPSIPNEVFMEKELIGDALQHRYDMQLLLQKKKTLELSLQLVKQQYRLAETNIGVIAQKDTDGTVNTGAKLETDIPLFDNGQAKVSGLDIQLAGIDAEVKILHLGITRDIQHALSNLRTAKIQHNQFAQELKTAERRVELAQREVNFSLISPFDLIELKSQSIQLEQDKTAATLSYWQARSQLELATGREIITSAITDEPNQAGSAGHSIENSNPPLGTHHHD